MNPSDFTIPSQTQPWLHSTRSPRPLPLAPTTPPQSYEDYQRFNDQNHLQPRPTQRASTSAHANPNLPYNRQLQLAVTGYTQSTGLNDTFGHCQPSSVSLADPSRVFMAQNTTSPDMGNMVGNVPGTFARFPFGFVPASNVSPSEKQHLVDMSPVIQGSPNPFGSPSLSPVDDYLDLPSIDISPQQNFTSFPMTATLSHVSATSDCFDSGSPLFADLEPDMDTWPDFMITETEKIDAPTFVADPVFPPTQTIDSVPMQRDDSATSTYSKSSISPSMTYSGVTKRKNPRKRQELPVLDLSAAKDATELKRMKNTAAARKSREKKAQLVETLEREVAIKNENERLLLEEIKELKRQLFELRGW